MPDDNPFDPYISRKQILEDIGIDASTLNAWIARGDFPQGEILNPGQTREIAKWRSSVYRQWKADRPQRAPRPITANAYSEEAIAKGRQTRAARRAKPLLEAKPEPTPEPEPAPQPEPPPEPRTRPGLVKLPRGAAR
jgi:predicted DNA-binding transcriptional regulator AlpA